MKFTSPDAVEQVVWSMKLADNRRGTSRRLINELFNGEPPYTTQEVNENDIHVNVNFLESTKIAHDARRQFLNAFLKPGNFFHVTLDSGPPDKRGEWSKIITQQANRIMKRSLPYIESLRSTFASLVLHGIGPTVWPDKSCWIPNAVGVEDVLIPSGTYISMENLQHFAVYKQYTAAQLYRLTHGQKVDPGWNMPVVDKALEWAHDSVGKTSNYTASWFPEKLAEAVKGDLGFYATDMVPTIDCWDFFYLDEERVWKRKTVFDYETGSVANGELASAKSKIGTRGKFLYDSGDRPYADELCQIIHFQFADASAVGPFRYHTVRSLGFLLYSVCHLQNRLRSRINEAAFEALMQYFRASDPDSAERVTKINLVNRGIIPDGIEFLGAKDRWQYNESLAQNVMNSNRLAMADNSTSFTQDWDFARESSSQTATEVIAKVNSSAALVSAMLNQAYIYSQFQYIEICRRLAAKNSPKKDSKKFREECRKRGVPEQMLDVERWDIEPERVLGSGNKSLEIAQADRLMSVRNLYDPEPQREILHNYTLAVTDDPGLASRLAPIGKDRFSNAKYEAQLAMGTLMLGLPVSPKPAINHIEYIETLLASLSAIIQKIEMAGGNADEATIVGLKNVDSHIAMHIQMLAQDPNEKERVKQYADDLGRLMNLVKAYEQRLAQQQQQAGPQLSPEAISKMASEKIVAEAKAANMRESHAQRTAQRQIQWEMEQGRKQDEHNQQMRNTQNEAALNAMIKTAESLEPEGPGEMEVE